jgi:hypothetical protein
VSVSDAPTSARGTISGGTLNGWAQSIDELEHVADLTWPLSVRTFQKMRHDPVLTSVVAAYRHPIMSSHWWVDPRGASDKMVGICADSLGLPVLGKPRDAGPLRRRGVQWRDHLRLASTIMLTFGHAPFEPVYDTSTGTAMLATLGERLPASIVNIQVDPDGTLNSIEQVQTLAGVKVQPIPGSRLLWYARDREGAAWQGSSILRPAFGPWLLKQEAIRVQATSLRRFGAGTPTMEPYPGSNPTQSQIAAAQEAASSVRVGDSGGVTTPGFTLKILGITGTIPDSMPFLAYLDQQMARAALASMLDLGNTSNGSRALGATFADLLAIAQQSTAEMIAETATELCVRLTDYNEGETANSPAVVVGDVAASRQVLAQSIAALVTAKAISPDEELEKWVRDAYDLPQRTTPIPPPPVPPALQPAAPAPTDPAATPPDAPVPPDPPPPKAKPKPVAAAAGDVPDPTDGRPLTPEEQAAGLDPQQMDDSHAEVLAALVAAWLLVQAAQHESIIGQVADLLAKGSRKKLTKLTVDTTDAAETLAVGMLDAWEAGARTAVAEAAFQGIEIAAPAVDTAALDAMASAVADVMGQATAAAASRQALQLAGATGPVDAEQVAADVGTWMDGLSDAWTTDQLSAAVGDGMGAGRAAVFEAGPNAGARYFSSEVRDKATCSNCLAIDGHEFASLEEAQAAYAGGWYHKCLGRLRCRGLVFVNWDTESPDMSPGTSPHPPGVN